MIAKIILTAVLIVTILQKSQGMKHTPVQISKVLLKNRLADDKQNGDFLLIAISKI